MLPRQVPTKPHLGTRLTFVEADCIRMVRPIFLGLTLGTHPLGLYL
jgi:hypothetical protein